MLQLQKAVGATRRSLAACLLRSSLAAAGRARCTHALRCWAASLAAHERVRQLLDVRSANRAAETARTTARSAEGIAKEVRPPHLPHPLDPPSSILILPWASPPDPPLGLPSSLSLGLPLLTPFGHCALQAEASASKDVDAVRRRLQAAEKGRATLRAEVRCRRWWPMDRPMPPPFPADADHFAYPPIRSSEYGPTGLPLIHSGRPVAPRLAFTGAAAELRTRG